MLVSRAQLRSRIMGRPWAGELQEGPWSSAMPGDHCAGGDNQGGWPHVPPECQPVSGMSESWGRLVPWKVDNFRRCFLGRDLI